MQNGEVITTSKIQEIDDEEPKFISVQITAELNIPDDFMGFDADQDAFRRGDLQKDLIGEVIKIKSGVYENAAWGNITSVVALDADHSHETGQVAPVIA